MSCYFHSCRFLHPYHRQRNNIFYDLPVTNQPDYNKIRAYSWRSHQKPLHSALDSKSPRNFIYMCTRLRVCFQNFPIFPSSRLYNQWLIRYTHSSVYPLWQNLQYARCSSSTISKTTRRYLCPAMFTHFCFFFPTRKTCVVRSQIPIHSKGVIGHTLSLTTVPFYRRRIRSMWVGEC